MLHKTTQFVILILLFVIVCLWLLTGCASKTLPQSAQDVLDEHIAGLDDSASGYEIVSVQKATGTPDDGLKVNPIPEAHPAGICPPAGESEIWCVVIDRSIADDAGRTFSHFLVQRQGRYWDVESLTDSEEEAFLYVGCDNWNVTDKG